MPRRLNPTNDPMRNRYPTATSPLRFERGGHAKRSHRRPATVNRDDRAGDVAGFVRREEQRGVRDLRRLALPSEEGVPNLVLVPGLAGLGGIVDADGAGAEHVDAHVMLTEVA